MRQFRFEALMSSIAQCREADELCGDLYEFRLFATQQEHGHRDHERMIQSTQRKKK